MYLGIGHPLRRVGQSHTPTVTRTRRHHRTKPDHVDVPETLVIRQREVLNIQLAQCLRPSDRPILEVEWLKVPCSNRSSTRRSHRQRKSQSKRVMRHRPGDIGPGESCTRPGISPGIQRYPIRICCPSHVRLRGPQPKICRLHSSSKY